MADLVVEGGDQIRDCLGMPSKDRDVSQHRWIQFNKYKHAWKIHVQISASGIRRAWLWNDLIVSQTCKGSSWICMYVTSLLCSMAKSLVQKTR